MSNPSPDAMQSTGADTQRAQAAVEHSLLKKSGPDDTLLTVYHKVEKKLAGQLKRRLTDIIGCELAVEMASSDTLAYLDWYAAQETDAVYLRYHFGVSTTPIWVRISRLFLTASVDCFFGGNFDGETCTKGNLTRSEKGMIARLAAAIGDGLTDGWSAVLETKVRFVGFVHDKGDIEMDLDDPNILVGSARVALSGHAIEAIDFIQSIDGLAEIEPQLNRPLSHEISVIDPVWQSALKDSLDQVYMPVRSVLARPTMELSQLSRMAVGDILPVSPTDNVPLIIGDRVFAHGCIGEQNGGVAFKIKHFL
ncbi:FliM/FliN family flagellar motor switch protein [Parasphingorhabdus cellanae]|uniref:Flagellar motor switch protein FliM n=1 Tax=Parasphingorhabdus cellanae TaxID=2806553 RepID=A0ABX7T1L8_9SPHN|nr:FliM/FliN family flagellar motor switch protein [Parasphingorhabdus cellanae]QTD55459.1 FliM/FliN family flagellar motor switch protein [Parasphingorhabdus cellanae]